MKHKHERKQRGRRLWMGCLCLIMTAMVVMHNGVMPARAAQAVQKSTMESPVASAYALDRAGLAFKDGDAPYLNQLNYAFALIENGRVTGRHWQHIKAFERYVKKHPHILPIMAVGGWGADGFSQAAATAEGRKAFAQSAVELMEQHGFRGIDIDWEYPGSTAAGIQASEKDKENFTLLLKEVRSALDSLTDQDGAKRYLCVALGASPESTGYVELEKVGQIVDQINLMSYDLTGFDKTTGHHAKLKGSDNSGEAAVNYLIEQGVPKEKIMLGAAAYGRCWRQVQGGGDGLGQRAGTSGNKIYSYGQLKQMMGDFETHWDDEAKAPYLFNGSQFISYEDPRSVGEKAAFARQKGLMGVVLWEYGQDNGELVRELKEP